MQARRKQLPDQLQGLWSDIPAWTATMLFMFQPVAQSVSSMLVAALHVGALGLVIYVLVCAHDCLAVLSSQCSCVSTAQTADAYCKAVIEPPNYNRCLLLTQLLQNKQYCSAFDVAIQVFILCLFPDVKLHEP